MVYYSGGAEQFVTICKYLVFVGKFNKDIPLSKESVGFCKEKLGLVLDLNSYIMQIAQFYLKSCRKESTIKFNI